MSEIDMTEKKKMWSFGWLEGRTEEVRGIEVLLMCNNALGTYVYDPLSASSMDLCMPLLVGRDVFETKKEAQQALLDVAEKRVEELKKEMTELQEVILLMEGWTTEEGPFGKSWNPPEGLVGSALKQSMNFDHAWVVRCEIKMGPCEVTTCP